MESKFKFIKNKKKLGIIAVVLIIIVIIGISSYSKAQKSQVKSVNISKVIKKNIAQSTVVSGTIQPNYRNEITLSNTQKVSKVLVTEGQDVKKDDVLVQMDSSDYKNELNKVQADLNNAQSAMSQTRVPGGQDRNGSGSISTSSIRAQIDSLNEKIAQCDIKSGVDGKVVKVDAKEGQVSQAGDKIIVDDDSKYKVSIDMSQYDAMKVSKGQKAIVKVKGNDKMKYIGSVTDIGEIAQTKMNDKNAQQEAKVNVIVTLNSAGTGDSIKSGYKADVEVVFNERQNAIVMGVDSIKQDKATKRKYVYIVNSENKVSKKYIGTGIETDDTVEVISGLSQGERYITNPSDSLKDGDIVKDASKAQTGGTNK
ncbi:efflux RND transporter periplasmic adaptor subunit [Clostridium sp. P21]|uniref:Efflux RND transporter periplasmic adaptor subunit n=1 Tax=Clostridium muellerianum TaxID=2716538 RepID=A0A7Y0EFJ3_9CLOT|nr:efflux RND transporter periplasmic adaptor subunit [Clostridium muellerianum]NMM62488.1 efflux RND transporter periplasmic adaptor subunit [Clostridium muellerianum]